MMKYCFSLVCLFFAGAMIGCGGAPTPVELPESEDAAMGDLTDEEEGMEDEANTAPGGE
ncbi:MAG: hypothetical protein ABGZ53_16120 [Fuerstiella sp.]